MLVRAQIGYQVIGGTKFYERAEVKDAIAYLTFLVNPRTAARSRGSPTRPSAGIGQTSLVARARPRGDDGLDAVGGRRGAGQRADARQARGQGARALHVDHGAAARARRGRRPWASCSRRRCRESGYLDALEAERTIEAQGRIENLQELVGVAREFDASVRRRGARRRDVPAADRAARRRGHDPRRRGPRDADDAPQREGPRVPDRVHHRLRGRALPARPRARRGRRSRRSAGSPTSASPARCATST